MSDENKPTVEHLLDRIIEMSVDEALGEMTRQAGPVHEQLALEARGAGLRGGNILRRHLLDGLAAGRALHDRVRDLGERHARLGAAYERGGNAEGARYLRYVGNMLYAVLDGEAATILPEDGASDGAGLPTVAQIIERTEQVSMAALDKALREKGSALDARDQALSQARQLECKISKLEEERDRFRGLLGQAKTIIVEMLNYRIRDGFFSEVNAAIGMPDSVDEQEHPDDDEIPIELDPVSVDNFRVRLAEGKYTRWARNLTLDQIEAVLWLVGEFGIRSSIEDHPLLNELPPGGSRRRVVALRGLIECQHRPMTFGDMLKYMREGRYPATKS